MANHAEVGFTYRQNTDGTVDSICRCCFRTVARAHDQASLYSAESNHRCSEEDARHFQRTSKRLACWADQD